MIVSVQLTFNAAVYFLDLGFHQHVKGLFLSPYTLHIHMSHRPRWPAAPRNSIAQNVYLTCYINPNYPH